MERIPEAILMEDIEQCIAFDNAPRKILRDIFLNNISKKIVLHESIVDLGCGPADYDIELCKIKPGCVITGIDGSSEMILIARKAVDNVNLNERILLKNLLFENIEETFDTVISTNTLHHTLDPNEFWRTVKKIGRKNVFILDLLRPASNFKVEELILQHASNTDLRYQKDFRNSLRAAFTVDEIKKQLIDNNIDNLTIETLDGKIVMIYGTLIFNNYVND